MCYISQTIESEIVEKFSFSKENEIDTITICIKRENKHTYINCTYRPPNGNINLFLEHFTKIIAEKRNSLS